MAVVGWGSASRRNKRSSNGCGVDAKGLSVVEQHGGLRKWAGKEGGRGGRGKGQNAMPAVRGESEDRTRTYSVAIAADTEDGLWQRLLDAIDRTGVFFSLC